MIIWIIDHYSVPVKYYPLARNTNFAKNLIKMGHEVIIFAASTVHNSEINLITNGSRYIEMIDDGIKYVLVKCHQYKGNGIQRILNMYEFATKLESVCDEFDRPDAIISTSMTLQACKKGIQIGQKYGCRKVAQITDLWPETLIAYGIAKKNHPLIQLFRRIEKWIYINADRIVFSMEGAYDYIIEQRWEKVVPRSKVEYINNGIDIELFEYNKEHFQVNDSDLEDESAFKIIYTGSIRKANDVGFLIDVVKRLQDNGVKLLIWGSGDEESTLKKRIVDEGIGNVVFKGRVEKKYIPFIVSKATYNIVDGMDTPLLRYGISANKIFDYFASGKPAITFINNESNPIIKNDAGVAIDNSVEKAANDIKLLTTLDSKRYDEMCINAKKTAGTYDFKNLTKKLIDTIEKIDSSRA